MNCVPLWFMAAETVFSRVSAFCCFPRRSCVCQTGVCECVSMKWLEWAPWRGERGSWGSGCTRCICAVQSPLWRENREMEKLIGISDRAFVSLKERLCVYLFTKPPRSCVVFDHLFIGLTLSLSSLHHWPPLSGQNLFLDINFLNSCSQPAFKVVFQSSSVFCTVTNALAHYVAISASLA